MQQQQTTTSPAMTDAHLQKRIRVDIGDNVNHQQQYQRCHTDVEVSCAPTPVHTATTIPVTMPMFAVNDAAVSEPSTTTATATATATATIYPYQHHQPSGWPPSIMSMPQGQWEQMINDFHSQPYYTVTAETMNIVRMQQRQIQYQFYQQQQRQLQQQQWLQLQQQHQPPHQQPLPGMPPLPHQQSPQPLPHQQVPPVQPPQQQPSLPPQQPPIRSPLPTQQQIPQQPPSRPPPRQQSPQQTPPRQQSPQQTPRTRTRFTSQYQQLHKDDVKRVQLRTNMSGNNNCGNKTSKQSKQSTQSGHTTPINTNTLDQGHDGVYEGDDNADDNDNGGDVDDDDDYTTSRYMAACADASNDIRACVVIRDITQVCVSDTDAGHIYVLAPTFVDELPITTTVTESTPTALNPCQPSGGTPVPPVQHRDIVSDHSSHDLPSVTINIIATGTYDFAAKQVSLFLSTTVRGTIHGQGQSKTPRNITTYFKVGLMRVSYNGRAAVFEGTLPILDYSSKAHILYKCLMVEFGVDGRTVPMQGAIKLSVVKKRTFNVKTSANLTRLRQDILGTCGVSEVVIELKN